MDHSQLIEIFKCKENFPYFCENYVKVMHPEKGLTSFKLHPFQKDKVYPVFEKEKFVILKKFRQAGLSTIASIYALWKILFFTDQRIVMISITDRDAKHLMSMIRRAWEELPKWMICETTEYSQHIIKLETGSEIKCGTKKMGRGLSANMVVVDEAAFIPKMEEIWMDIFPVVSAAGNTCKVFVVSTVNGLGNWYADKYHDAKDKKNEFYCLDLNYKEHPEYNNEEYVERMKAQLGPRGWDQEVLGIFLSASDTFIKPESIKMMKEMIDKSPEPKKLYNDKLWIWKGPRADRNYIIAADVAEGLGGDHDYSAFHVLDMVTLEQVCEFCDNEISTYKFAKIINEVGIHYNNAIAVVEGNGLGVGVLEKLYNDLDYENIHWSRVSKRNLKMGFIMTPKSRPLVLNSFSNLVENKHVKIRSSRIFHEIQTFEYNARTQRAEARYGRHDDLIMSMAMGLFVRNTIINELPIGVNDDYELDIDEFEPTFDPKHERILKLQDGDEEDVDWLKQSNVSEPIEFMDWYDDNDEESLLKEFGW